MKNITKENIEEFLDYYHGFHDSSIRDVKFNYKKGSIEIFINVFWSGEPSLKADGTYETHRTKMRMLCNNIIQYNYKENYTDYIDDAYLRFLIIDKKEYICFATDKEKPLISIVCENIEYEEMESEEKTSHEDEILNVHDEIMKVYDNANRIYQRLKDNCELRYFNKHLIKVHGSYIEQAYYMPVISMQEKGDICFNFDDVSYEFYLSRESLQKYLDVLIEKYADKLSIYTSANCDVDLYFVGDQLSDVNKKLEEYDKSEVIGITIDANDFSNKHIVDNFLELINLFKGENNGRIKRNRQNSL